MVEQAAPDVRVVNLETSVTRSADFAPGKAVHYRMTPDNLPCVAAIRPDVCALANNHVLDFGERGLRATLGALAGAGLAVLKADVPGLVHKTDAGGLELDLRTEADVRAAYRRLEERFGRKLRRILVQPMIGDCTEVIVGVADDHLFGPLVVFGLGGVATGVLADHAARLTPLTDVDADTLIRSIRSAPLLLWHRGSPAADLGALRDLLLRVSRLADDLPEVTDLDLNPVIGPTGYSSWTHGSRSRRTRRRTRSFGGSDNHRGQAALLTTPQERTSASRHALRPGCAGTRRRWKGNDMKYVPPGISVTVTGAG